jgi:IS605 OrfB family transposase
MNPPITNQPVIKTLHCRLPDLSPDQVTAINTRYSEAVIYTLHHLFTQGMMGKPRKEQREATKQVYHTLRKIPDFGALNAMLLDEACNQARELLHWVEQRLRRTETFTRLTSDTTIKITRWLQRLIAKTSDFQLRKQQNQPSLLQPPTENATCPTRLLSPPPGEFAKWPGWQFPGLRNGRVNLPAHLMQSAWAPITSPQSRGGTVRLHGAPRTGDQSLGLGRTRWQLGGVPLRLLQQALNREKGLRVGEPCLLLREGEPHLSIPVVRENPTTGSPEGLQETVVGVDIGANTLVAAVALQQNVPQPAQCVSGRQFCHQLRVLWQRRRRAARRHASSELHQIDAKLARVVNHWTNVAAKTVVDYASQQRGEVVIVLENLRDLRFARNRTPRWRRVTRFVLSVWARGQLHQRIKEKARWQGIPVVELSVKETRFSSKTCCKCGQVNHHHRQQRVFRCTACGAVIPRDVNAATVLAQRGVERMK